jgi:DNA-binding NtrC family response regulator
LVDKSIRNQGPDVTLDDLPPRIACEEPESLSDGLSYRMAVDAARRDVVTRALTHTHGNRVAAARLLGMHKTHLLNFD